MCIRDDTLFEPCVLSNCDQTPAMLLAILNENAVLLPNRTDSWRFGESYSERPSKYDQTTRVRLPMAEDAIVKTHYLRTVCAVLVVGATLIVAPMIVLGKAPEKTLSVHELQEKGTSYAPVDLKEDIAAVIAP
jgi:hypothetical protein